MITSYDPVEIIKKAQQWRAKAAATPDAAKRDECLEFAALYEQLVVRSIETPAIGDAVD
jgi:hypothetical protein